LELPILRQPENPKNGFQAALCVTIYNATPICHYNPPFYFQAETFAKPKNATRNSQFSVIPA